jgi:hypothetical protein
MCWQFLWLPSSRIMKVTVAGDIHSRAWMPNIYTLIRNTKVCCHATSAPSSPWFLTSPEPFSPKFLDSGDVQLETSNSIKAHKFQGVL